ncbi:SIS domain-containing protein [Asticcacaulis machinosus]|uniref:SIS domain-containing protein n=1 Tax=Asticcacaulis machinosus TaxID=2984211 RepID=A0ABT5HLV4_9CAUL|nr:SIS domain-containing protein [Asticcacaulis machinosus]MDC7677227.1 SIS domain-containing protein [Asticcacaulis machinosus]
MSASLSQPLKRPEDTLMFREARESGEAVARFLDTNLETIARIVTRLKAHPPRSVTTCARGSSDHAATYGKYLIETLIGIPTSTAALSVSSLYDSPVFAADTLCIAISQSGRSPDLLTSVKAHKDSGAFVIALVNDFTSPLAELADEALPLCAGPELSVAATKSYITSLAALAALVAHWADHTALKDGVNRLPQHLTQAFDLDWSGALATLTEARNLFVIGRGYSFAVAQEAALKLKETCALHAEAFSAAEVRHGPMAIVGEGFPIIAFAPSDSAGDDVRAVATEFSGRGADVWLADTKGQGEGQGNLPALAAEAVLEPLLMVASFYRLANALSIARGLDPDSPPHLNKVTRTV